MLGNNELFCGLPHVVWNGNVLIHSFFIARNPIRDYPHERLDKK
mgnify:CR=1 FL=1